MPRHRRPDLAEGLRRAFDVDPPGVFDTVSPEIVPVTLVSNARDEEFAALRGWPRFAGSAEVAGAGALYTHIQLFNPATSNVIVAVDWFACGSDYGVAAGDANGRMTIRRHDTALANAVGAINSRDRRGGPTVAEVRHQDLAAITGDLLLTVFTLGGNFRLWESPPGSVIVLQPGEGILAVPGGVAQSCLFTFVTREIGLAPLNVP